jgi:hypothetical protein
LTTLGTIELGTYTNVADTAITGSDPVLENIAGTNDADFVNDATNSSHTGQADFALGNMPADFGTMNSVEINLRYGKDVHTGTNTWDNLQAQILTAADVALTDNVNIATSITSTTPANSGAITLTSPDLISNKAVWDAAKVRISWIIGRSKGGDSDQEEVYAAEVTGDYDIAAAGPPIATVYHHMQGMKK